MATWLPGSLTSSINHEQVKGDCVPSQECMVCMAPQIVHWQERNECYKPSFFFYTNSPQSTMSCMGNPQAIIRKCVHPSMPHSNFYLLGNRAKIPKCNLQKKCCWFSQHFKSAKILCKGWQILYVFKLSFTFFMSNLLPQNLGTFFEIYRSATGLVTTSSVGEIL